MDNPNVRSGIDYQGMVDERFDPEGGFAVGDHSDVLDMIEADLFSGAEVTLPIDAATLKQYVDTANVEFLEKLQAAHEGKFEQQETSDQMGRDKFREFVFTCNDGETVRVYARLFKIALAPPEPAVIDTSTSDGRWDAIAAGQQADKAPSTEHITELSLTKPTGTLRLKKRAGPGDPKQAVRVLARQGVRRTLT